MLQITRKIKLLFQRKHSLIELSDGNTTATYIGDGEDGQEASVQGSHPLENYFEVEIISGGKGDWITVGLSPAGYDLSK